MKWKIILIIGVLSFQGISSNAFVGKSLQSIQNVEQVSFTFSDPMIVDKNNYCEVVITGAERICFIPGAPLLPSHIKTFSFPFGTQIIDISCDVYSPRYLDLSKIVTPAVTPISQGENLQDDGTFFNVEIYESSTFYPLEWYSYYVSSGLDDGNSHQTFLTLEIFPVRYCGKSDTIQYVETVDVTITYEEPETVFHCGTNDYDMLIITPNIFSDKLQPLVEHKNKYGIETILKTTEDIYAEYDGCDHAEQIKYFIKEAIESWDITYVLLVGGLKSMFFGVPRDNKNIGDADWYLPVRYTNHFDDTNQWYTDSGFICDLYYADIYNGTGGFSSWDSNNDGVFADWPKYGAPVDLFDC